MKEACLRALTHIFSKAMSPSVMVEMKEACFRALTHTLS